MVGLLRRKHVFNLDELNVVELCKKLRNELDDSSEPWFLFTSKRKNAKLELKRERIDILQRTVESMINTNTSLANVKANIMLSEAVKESIINNHYIEQTLSEELRQREHDDQIQAIDDTAHERALNLEAQEIVNLRARAEVNLLNAQTQSEQAKADLIKFVVENIDLKNMPQILQTFVIQSIINPGGSASVADLDLQAELREFMKKEAEAKARILNAQAKQNESQADIGRATADDTIHKMRSRRRD